MKVYVVLIEDRHSGIDVELCQNKVDALKAARLLVHDWAEKLSDIVNHEPDDDRGIIYSSSSREDDGNTATVLEREL